MHILEAACNSLSYIVKEIIANGTHVKPKLTKRKYLSLIKYTGKKSPENVAKKSNDNGGSKNGVKKSLGENTPWL